MTLYDQLIKLDADIYYGIDYEAMDRLSRIAWDIVRDYKPGVEFVYQLQRFDDYFEQWGVCGDTFGRIYKMCMDTVGPADAECTE